MSHDDHSSGLASLTGLDKETVDTQLVPFLHTFNTRQSLINHLQDLVGPGAAQRAFIASYADSRFPPTKAVPSEQQSGVQESVQQRGTRKTGTKKSKFPSKLPPVRQVHGGPSFVSESAYRKGQDDFDEDDALLFGGRKAGKSPASTAPRDSPQPHVPQLSSASPSKPSSVFHDPDQRISSTHVVQASKSHEIPPSEDMKKLQYAISRLQGETTEKQKLECPCFCQGTFGACR